MTNNKYPRYKTAIGQDSHRFAEGSASVDRPLVLAGLTIPGEPGLSGNSDADVVLHAVTNAISGITGINILGNTADRMCLEEGITDSAAYLGEALKHMRGYRAAHLSVSIEAARPKLADHIHDMRSNLATLLSLEIEDVGMTATSGEGLTDFGRGMGMQAFCILTVVSDSSQE